MMLQVQRLTTISLSSVSFIAKYVLTCDEDLTFCD